MLTKKTIPIDQIIPYWRNPRNATDADIAKIMSSIEEYGYVNWLILDEANTIVTGHTRYLALRRLGYTELDVYISDMEQKEAKEYRIIDNRTAEGTGWDREKLIAEIGEDPPPLMSAFFPELDLNLHGELATGLDLSLPSPVLDRVFDNTPASVTATCTHCYHSFELNDSHVVKETA